MAKPYFRQVPNFEYISRTKGEQYLNEYVTLKNLFKRAKLREDIFENLAFFEKYSIVGDERPDNVAAKFYNESTLDWVILLANNILNIQDEWPMTTQTFEQVMLEKYGSYETLQSGIHHYETLEIKNTLGLTVLQGGLRISPTWKTNGNFLEMVNTKIANISCGVNAESLTPSSTVYVYVLSDILGLQVGDQITIDGVADPQYRGQHIVKELLATDINGAVSGFTYELPFIPNDIQPRLSDPRKEEVHYTIKESSTNTGNSYYYEFWDPGLGYAVQVPSTSFVRAVTNYEYEIEKEEAKRNIYILKPQYLNVIYNDLDELMPYKKGGVQYVNSSLKRADNIRLTT